MVDAKGVATIEGKKIPNGLIATHLKNLLEPDPGVFLMATNVVLESTLGAQVAGIASMINPALSDILNASSNKIEFKLVDGKATLNGYPM